MWKMLCDGQIAKPVVKPQQIGRDRNIHFLLDYYILLNIHRLLDYQNILLIDL